MLLGALSTGHEIGLGVVAAAFIAFALASALLVPRRNPDFPGRTGLSVYVIASLALFAAMVAAIVVFGRESEPAEAHAAPAGKTAATGTTLDVQEKEYRIELPASAQGTLGPGTYTFRVHDAGAIAHDLAVQAASGPIEKTPLIQPGGDGTLTVTLAKGVYDVFCTVPGHRAAGMEAKLTVG